MRTRLVSLAIATLILGTFPSAARGAAFDLQEWEIDGKSPGAAALEWVRNAHNVILNAGTNPPSTGRQTAMVAAAMFDAVNGVEGHYQPIHVTEKAAGHASAPAAVIQAAYVVLIRLYPSPPIVAQLTALRDASLAKLVSQVPDGSVSPIQAGIAWGQHVADDIVAWRNQDGNAPVAPPFVGALGLPLTSATVGIWRPTPLGDGSPGAPAGEPQIATVTPWVMTMPSQFRLPAPPSLTSAEFAANYNEVKTMGGLTSPLRTPDQTESALFWAGNTPLYWNRIAVQVVANRGWTLLETARLFAQLNLAMADAGIACWDGKFRYVTSRPVTAIRAGDLDGNAATDPDPTWRPLFDVFPTSTPAIPEFPSGHSTISAAAAYVLESAFGDATPFTLQSEVRAGTRPYASFSAAVTEVGNARVFGGIHYRFACDRGSQLGRKVGQWAVEHAMQHSVQ